MATSAIRQAVECFPSAHANYGEFGLFGFANVGNARHANRGYRGRFCLPGRTSSSVRLHTGGLQWIFFGIGHFHWDGGSWQYDYNITLASSQKAQHLAVDYSVPSSPILYVTPTAATANNLYKITDPGPGGANAVQTTIGTAAAGCAFRGVAMAPAQPALPAFTTQPVGTTNNYGSTATFGPVDATGTNPNAWTWLKGNVPLANGPTGNGSTVSGATSTTLAIANIAILDADNVNLLDEAPSMVEPKAGLRRLADWLPETTVSQWRRST